MPTPAPRTAPLIAATALAGAFGCGPRHDRAVPPQVVEPDPSSQPPMVEADAGPPDSAAMAPADEERPVPPQVPQVPPKPPQPRPE